MDLSAKAPHVREAILERRASLAAAQDEELPGERERVTNALDRLPPETIVRLLRDSLRSLDGLRAVASHVLPPEAAPTPNVLRCLRCDESFDPAFAGRKSCKVQHPDACVHTDWESSKRSWDHCRRCDATFNLNGFHSWGRHNVSDDGEWCFEGEHTTDPRVVAEEKWDEDPDY